MTSDPTIFGHGQYDEERRVLYVTQDQYEEIRRTVPEAKLDPIPSGHIGAPPEGISVVVSVQCGSCRRFRRPDEFGYSPIQPVLGQQIGWYSGDDGELCGPCMADLMNARKR